MSISRAYVYLNYSSTVSNCKKKSISTDKRVELDGIRIDAGYIALTIQWYEHIPGISWSDLDYRFYCNNPPLVQKHNQILHGTISTTQIFGTVERHNSIRNKIQSPSESLHGNGLQWKLNDRREFYNTIDK